MSRRGRSRNRQCTELVYLRAVLLQAAPSSSRAESALGAAAMSTATLAGRPRQRASALARSPGHGRGQFELDTVRVFKGKHVNPERRQASDLAVRHPAVIEQTHGLF
jgi:hypothetical protein